MLSETQRQQFDGLLDTLIEQLPDHLRQVLDEVPLIVEDEPASSLLHEMKIDPARATLCGLHWGVPLTQRSVHHGARMPDRMMLFRGPIMRVARAHHGPGMAGLQQQIRVTLLHEIGHHFGLTEDDLRELGYG